MWEDERYNETSFRRTSPSTEKGEEDTSQAAEETINRYTYITYPLTGYIQVNLYNKDSLYLGRTEYYMIMIMTRLSQKLTSIVLDIHLVSCFLR